MPYVVPTVAVIDRAGNLWCMACAGANAVVADVEWPSDNSALEDALSCRGCGQRVQYDPKAKVWEP